MSRHSTVVFSCIIVAVFEARILEYREEMASEPASSLRHNVKLVSKKIKGFFAESGKLQHCVKFAAFKHLK